MTEDNSPENKTETTTTEQTAVAEPTPEPKEAPAADEGKAQEDVLDDLLKEFDIRREPAAAKPKEAPQPVSEPKTDALPMDALADLAAIKTALRETEARATRRELDTLFKEFTEGVDADPVDAEMYLGAMAKKNKKLEELWLRREEEPVLWEKTKRELKQDFARRRGKKVDRQATDSRDAVAAAVRSASNAAPQKELTDRDIYSMPKDEFDALSRKLGITPI